MEAYYFYALVTGAILAGLACLWLIVAAFRTHWGWGLGVTVLFPILGPIFLVARPERARKPVALLLFGSIIVAGTFAVNRLASHYIDFGPRDKIVDGERHLTLTGWKDGNYADIAARPDTVVLQMANSDVTDATLDYLAGLTKLRELDLNDAQITDAGLAKLKALPLTTLRLKGTKITDAGFREHVLPREAIMELDLRETDVKAATAREWKNAKPERKYLK
ncbi:MAG: hypothetical protein U0746_19545 [Gemmataceae bacterium]